MKQSNNMNKREVIKLDKCYFCKSKSIKEKKESIISRSGNLIDINAFECEKCGESFYSMDETERIRKILNPSLLQKIKNLFNKPSPKINILKGRVL